MIRKIAWAMLLASVALFSPHAAGAEPFSFDCVVDPSLQTRLGSPVTGVLDTVEVRRGQTVRKGQVIARVDAAVEAADVNVLAMRASSRADIEAQEARLHLAEQKLARMQTLNQLVSQADIDELDADVKVAQRELAAAELRKKVAELELARARTQLDQHMIRSPMDGIVVERHMTAGEYVDQEAGIATIAQIDPLYAETFLPVEWYSQLAVGTEATVVLHQPADESHQARVTVVDQVFDSSSGTFGVRLEIPNPGNVLPAGQRCEVTFDLRRADAGASEPPAGK